ncbi:amidohydrolase family protein [Thalassobius sp. Cn5-15]|uniref:N-acyl-D-amino-acid deacylase family protein n=1 Tax=Thalassobius sp. Cn5-15 TaxID=2917763 RepID=UPI001EF1B492|nr:D-aminoacylase [Thalassobius sp. Cn5-15]MCG7492753.1 D-aminoacylase [Thalassobius sp. Cn5-15]
MYDLTISNATVVDGTGGERYLATVCIKDEKIVRIERGGGAFPSQSDVDAQGLILAPGFIDVHTHDDIALIANPDMVCKTSQGITTVIVGLCGYSPAPFSPNADIPAEYDILLQSHSQRFERFADYLEAVKQAKPSVNYLGLVGHSTLRLSVMDDVNRPATDREIAKMADLLVDSMNAGAIGLSSGLAYSMAQKSDTRELIELCKAMSDRNGFYVTHIRNEADGMIDGVKEALKIGRDADVPVIFSHHKAMCDHNHGTTKHSLKLIDAAAAEQTLALDVYPYCYSSTSLTRERALRGGHIVIARSDPMPQMVGKSLCEVAELLNCSEADAVDQLAPAGALYYLMSEDDVQRVMKYPMTMIGSDGLPFDEKPHPRLWGTFPRVLSRYVRDIPVYSLEEAVHRMTGLPSKVFGLKNRGVIAEGNFADMVLFSETEVADQATADQPKKTSKGIAAVFVAGKPPSEHQGKSLESRHVLPCAGSDNPV